MRGYLAEQHDLPHDLDEQTVRKTIVKMMTNGKLTADKYLDIIIPEHHEQDRTINDKDNTTMADSKVSPAQVFGGAGSVNVKAPSARYNTKRYEAKHPKTGQTIYKNDLSVELPSEREHALMGAYFLNMAHQSRIKGARPMTDHELDLLNELANDHEWCGTVGGDNGVYHTRTKLAHAMGRKATDFIATSVSGGDGLVPYFFDQDIVTYPLLFGELAPMVDMRELGTSNQAITPRIGNITSAWNGSEGSGSAISLFTTDALSDKLTSNVYNLVMAITPGRDLLSDSVVNIGSELTKLMGVEHAHQLDKVVAMGDGTTQPKGLTNTTGTGTVSATNATAGPFLPADFNSMVSGLPKQYRDKNDPKICWVMNDATWFRIHNIKTGISGDNRQLYGYQLENYSFLGRDVKISNDLAANNLFFGKLDLYRMWRRLGLQIEMTDDGKTNRLNNELLITARGRYAGQFTDGAGIVVMSNAALH